MPLSGSSSSFHRQAPGLLKAVAIAAIAAGVGVWGVLLLAPASPESPPLLHAHDEVIHDTSKAAQWFGGAQLRVRVTATGVIAGADGRGTALLSVDGEPVQAYRTGQTLAPGVVLSAVSSSTVSINQEGVIEEVAVPASPFGKVQGFVPVAAQAQ